MQHPFDGVVPSSTPSDQPSAAPSRRGALKVLFGGLAMLLGLKPSRADAHGLPGRPIPRPLPTTYRLGEEGGLPRPTTRRFGEEAGRGRITTLRLGEEGGKPATTYLYFEEGGWVTTQALGEEGGRF